LQDFNEKLSWIDLLIVSLKALFAAKIPLVLADIALIYSLETGPTVLIVWYFILS
jgi:hypothetical protein